MQQRKVLHRTPQKGRESWQAYLQTTLQTTYYIYYFIDAECDGSGAAIVVRGSAVNRTGHSRLYHIIIYILHPHAHTTFNTMLILVIRFYIPILIVEVEENIYMIFIKWIDKWTMRLA